MCAYLQAGWPGKALTNVIQFFLSLYGEFCYAKCHKRVPLSINLGASILLHIIYIYTSNI